MGDNAQGGAVAERENRSPARRPTLRTAHCILRVVFGGNYDSERILTMQTKHSTLGGGEGIEEVTLESRLKY